LSVNYATSATYATHLNASNLVGSSSWTWNPFNLTQYWCWGESFKNTNIGSDSGDLRFYLAGISSAGGTGICMNIDGHIASLSTIYAGTGFIHGGYNSSSYLLLSNGSVKAVSDFATSGHTHMWEASSYSNGSYNWTYDQLSLSDKKFVYGWSFKDTSIGSDVGVMTWYTSREGSSYTQINLCMDGCIQVAGKMYAANGMYASHFYE
jgi:hypothetical protein